MTFPKRLSITWQVRLVNGTISAIILTTLIVLAQVRIRSVLYGALDRTLLQQAHGIVDDPGRPGPPEERRGFDRGPGGPGFGGPGGDDNPGGPPDGPPGGRDFHGDRPGFGGPDGGIGRGGPGHGGPGPRENQPLKFGVFALLPARRLLLDAQRGPSPWSVAGRDAAEKRGEDQRSEILDDGSRIRVISVRTAKEDKRMPIVVQTAAILEPIDATVREIDSVLYSLLVPLALFAAVLGGFLTEMALAPVRRMAQAIGQIEPTNLDARLPEPGGGDAFDSLAHLLNAMLVRLESAFARQKRFTASASHELRTPLAVIKSATSLLLENPESLSPLQQRTLDRADQSVDRANRLITDLLTLTRTENGILPVRVQSVSMHDVLHEVADEIPQASRNLTRIETDVQPGDLVFRTDGDHLRRLLQNLLSNALRHTPQGTVSVSATSLAGSLVLVVRDTGDGISPEALPRLGEPFYRPDESRARDSGGAGLGLSLCWGIISALGGRWNIESTVGVGTTVTVTIPPASPESPAQQQ